MDGYSKLASWFASVKDPFDYQGRSFLHPPQDVGVNLRSEEPPEKCFLPKKQIYTWTGHTKGVAAIRWFPHSAHLLLSCSMDSKIKVRGCWSTRVGIITALFMGETALSIDGNPSDRF